MYKWHKETFHERNLYRTLYVKQYNNQNKITMRQSIALLQGGFESSSSKTPEFVAFAKLFKKQLTAQLKTINCTLTNYSVGHFYVSGFFRTTTGECYYFSLSDVRESKYLLEREGCIKLLWRTAKDEKDYTGGHNRYVRINDEFAESIGNQIYMDKNKVSFLLVD